MTNTDAETKAAEIAPAYKPQHRFRVSVIGLLRNSAGELQAAFDERERQRQEHEDEECECEACSQTDWGAFHAAGLLELAEHIDMLDKDPAQFLFEWADLYALHGLAEFAQASLLQKETP